MSQPPMVGLDRGRPPPSRPPEQERIFVYRLMIAGASRDQIVDMGSAAVPPFGRELICRLYAQICKELGDAASLPEYSRENLRALTVEQIRREIVDLSLRQQTLDKADHRNFVALTREKRHYLSLLSDIEGTKQLEVKVGIDVDVRVRSASMRVIAGLTRDDFARIGQEMIDVSGE